MAARTRRDNAERRGGAGYLPSIATVTATGNRPLSLISAWIVGNAEKISIQYTHKKVRMRYTLKIISNKIWKLTSCSGKREHDGRER